MSENQNGDLGRLYLETKHELNRQSERAAGPSTSDALAQMARPGWASTLTEADVTADPSVSAITRQVEKHDDNLSRVDGQCAVGQHPTAGKPQMGRFER